MSKWNKPKKKKKKTEGKCEGLSSERLLLQVQLKKEVGCG
jgi:hypothetical protein